jgi:hypothetical protein
LARLDERLRHSPLREGWTSRHDFVDAAASLWLSGHLVHLEDLVLRDADMNVNVPTVEMGEACEVLRARRILTTEPPGWSLSSDGLDRLRGRCRKGEGGDASFSLAGDDRDEDEGLEFQHAGAPAVEGDEIADRELAAAIRLADAAMASSQRVLSRVTERPTERSPLVYDEDWDEEGELARWRRVVTATATLPPTLGAVIALDAWEVIQPLQRQPWLGRLIAADLLRQRGKLGMLACLSVGLKLIERERRRGRDQATRWAASLEAIAAMAHAGLKDHDRWLTARNVFGVKLKERRSTSRLPDLIDLVMRRPMVTTGLVAQELRISSRSAQALITELGVRELTGRGRYRAWGVL